MTNQLSSIVSKLRKLRRMSPAEMATRLGDANRLRRESGIWRRGETTPLFPTSSPFNASDIIAACQELIRGSQTSQLESARQNDPTRFSHLQSTVEQTATDVLSGNWTMLGHDFDLRGEVDWHQDPRSEFRWDRKFYGDLTFAGRDVKYVWELGRHQYLADLSRSRLLSGNETHAVRAETLLLDWISHNPLYEGVHWTSALEVAMRAISWVWTLSALAGQRHFDDQTTYSADLMSRFGVSHGSRQSNEETGANAQTANRKNEETGANAQTANRKAETGASAQTANPSGAVMLGDRIDLGGDSMRTIANSLADHATYLQHHFSYYSSPFNHLIGEATGLYLIGCVLRQHERSGEWRRLARQVLDEHGPRQFYDDGVGVEQAMGYQFYTLGFLSLSILAARCEGSPLTKLEHVTHQGFLAAAAFRKPDGRWPPFGDLDSARAMPVHHRDYWRFGSLCSLAAVLFDDPELAFDSEPGDELYWLLGAAGWQSWDKLANSSSSKGTDARQHVLSDSGYVVAADRDDWMLFDAGPIAGGLFADSTPSVAHGHADMLQVLYWMNGADVLRDSGMPFYVGAAGHADYFRSPAAHNTLEVAGAAVAKVAGQLAWSNVATKPTLAARVNNDVWLARGRVAFDDVVIRRYVLAIPRSGMWVTDWIESKKNRDVSWYWQLGANDFQASLADSLRLRNEHGLTVRMWCADSMNDWEMTAANAASPVGWEATGYGVKHPGSRLRLSVPCAGSLLMTSFIGRTHSPCQLERVTVGGHAVTMIEGKLPTIAQNSFAEIAWTVGDRESRRTFLAGSPSAGVEQLSNAREISGEGDWPVVVVEHEPSEFRSTGFRSDVAAANGGTK